MIVLNLTYMVIWMRRLPKDLMTDASASAASRLARGSAKALPAMAFFAVVLVLSPAGLVMPAIRAANSAGWVVFAPTPPFALSRFTPPGTVPSSSTRATIIDMRIAPCASTSASW